jgi:hypothetical protein
MSIRLRSQPLQLRFFPWLNLKKERKAWMQDVVVSISIPTTHLSCIVLLALPAELAYLNGA